MPSIKTEKFIDLIRDRLGILVNKTHVGTLEKTILVACDKFNLTPDAYFDQLRTCVSYSPMIENLLVGITVGETYFFRDKSQINFLKDTVLPEMILNKQSKGDLTLRIWSAGCSTGEEIYTILMLLHDMLVDFKKWNFHLLATDINVTALHKGAKGCYGEWALRSIPDHFKYKYFIKEKNNYIFLPELCGLVHFDYLNLNENTYPSIINGTNAQDLILCRNVLIYFDSNHVPSLMKKLSNSLVDGGYLLLGASDPVFTTDLSLTRYHFKDKTSTHLFVKNSPVMPVPEIIKDVPKIKVAMEEVNKSHLEDETIVQLVSEEKWDKALDRILDYEKSHALSVELLNFKAKALANLGELELAEECCEASLKIDKANRDTYFTLYLVLQGLNEINEAEMALRKSIFLDHKFIMGHFQLGLLLLNLNQHEAGIKSLKNALAIVESRDPSQAIPEFQGLYCGRLAEILKNEIEIHAE